MRALGRLVARELGVPSREPAASLAPALAPDFDVPPPRADAALAEPPPHRQILPSSHHQPDGADAAPPPAAPPPVIVQPPRSPSAPRAAPAIETPVAGPRVERAAPAFAAEREGPGRGPMIGAPHDPTTERVAQGARFPVPVVPRIEPPTPPNLAAVARVVEPISPGRAATETARAMPRPDHDAQPLRPLLPPTPPPVTARHEASAPPVQITIGRLEIRASRETPPTASPRAPAERAAPSLASYLRRRSSGERS